MLYQEIFNYFFLRVVGPLLVSLTSLWLLSVYAGAALEVNYQYWPYNAAMAVFTLIGLASSLYGIWFINECKHKNARHFLKRIKNKQVSDKSDKL